MFLLDTNAASELPKARSGRTDPSVERWADGVDAGPLRPCAITVLELGVVLAERRSPGQGAFLRAWLDMLVIPVSRGRMLPVDTAVALRCARLHVPDRCSERDALIAATALVHGLTVVTRDVGGFEPTGVPLLNPWTGRAAAAR